MDSQVQLSSQHIVMVDDDDDDRITFADVLHEIDSTIPLTQVENGQKCMELLDTMKDGLPEILFLDINMPIKNGFECLEEIRKHDSSLSSLKIVILSTSKSPSDLARSHELGASFYAVKPNTYSEWKIMLTEILTMEWFTPPFIKTISK